MTLASDLSCGNHFVPPDARNSEGGCHELLARKTASLRSVNRDHLYAPAIVATLAKPLPGFTLPLPCFFPFCLVGTVQIPRRATKEFKTVDGVKQRRFINQRLLI